MEPGRKMEIQMKSTLLNCVLIVGLCPLAAAQLRLPGAAHVESREKPGPLYITWMVHVDPSNWTLPNKFDHGCFILDQMADLVEAHGGLMCATFSRPFLDGCQSLANGPSKPGSVGDLAARGHEIGYHPHSGDLVSDTQLIQTLVAGYTSQPWPSDIEGGGDHALLSSLGYRTGAGCGKDQASQLFQISLRPYRPVEGDCYGQDPAGLMIHLGSGAVDGAGQASNNLDEIRVGLQYAIDKRRSDKLNFANLTTTHPDDWFSSPASEVLADFQLIDAWMTSELDPLLARGVVAWANPSKKADMFEAWEASGGDNSDLFPPPLVSDPDWDYLDSTNSPLASDLVDEVLIDSQDRLWIGSGDEVGGLSLLDGGVWTSFTSSNSPLRSNRITALAEGVAGDLWIGGFSTGPGTSTALYRFDGLAWSVFDSSNSPIPDPFLFEVAVDPAGVVWVGGKSGLYRYDGSWTTYTALNSGLPANQRAVWSIDAYSASALYLGLRTGGAVHFQHQGDSLPVNDVWTVHDRSTTSDALPADTVHAVAYDGTSRLLVGTMRGLAVSESGVWSTYTSTDSDLGYDQICDIAFDSTGRAWLATFGGGVTRFDPSTGLFENFQIPDGTIHTHYNQTIALDSSDQMFVGSLRAGGVSLYSGN